MSEPQLENLPIKKNNLLLSLIWNNYEPQDCLFLHYILPDSVCDQTNKSINKFQQRLRNFGFSKKKIKKIEPLQEKCKKTIIYLSTDYRKPFVQRRVPLISELRMKMENDTTQIWTSFTPIAQKTILPKLIKTKGTLLDIALLPPMVFKFFFLLEANRFRQSFAIGFEQLLHYLGCVNEYSSEYSESDVKSFLRSFSVLHKIIKCDFKMTPYKNGDCIEKIIIKFKNFQSPPLITHLEHQFAFKHQYRPNDEKKLCEKHKVNDKKLEDKEAEKISGQTKYHITPHMSRKVKKKLIQEKNLFPPEKVRELIRKSAEKREREWETLVQKLKPLSLSNQKDNPQLKGHEDDPELAQILAVKDAIIHGKEVEEKDNRVNTNDEKFLSELTSEIAPLSAKVNALLAEVDQLLSKFESHNDINTYKDQLAFDNDSEVTVDNNTEPETIGSIVSFEKNLKCQIKMLDKEKIV